MVGAFVFFFHQLLTAQAVTGFAVQPASIVPLNAQDYGNIEPRVGLANVINQNGLNGHYSTGSPASVLQGLTHLTLNGDDSVGMSVMPPPFPEKTKFRLGLDEEFHVIGMVMWSNPASTNLGNFQVFCEGVDENDQPVLLSTHGPTSTEYYVPRVIYGNPAPATFVYFPVPQRAKNIQIWAVLPASGNISIGEIAFLTDEPIYNAWRMQLGLPLEGGVEDAEVDGIPDVINWALGDGVSADEEVPVLPGVPVESSLLWIGQDVEPRKFSAFPVPTQVVNQQPITNPPPSSWSAVEDVSKAGEAEVESRVLENGVLTVHYSKIREYVGTKITYTPLNHVQYRKTTTTTRIRVKDYWTESFRWPANRLQVNSTGWTLNLVEHQDDYGTRAPIQLQYREGGDDPWKNLQEVPIGTKTNASGSFPAGTLVSHVRLKVTEPSSEEEAVYDLPTPPRMVLPENWENGLALGAFSNDQEEAVSLSPIQIGNQGGAILTVTASVADSGEGSPLQLGASSFEVAYNATYGLGISFLPQGLEAGEWTGTIVLETNDPDRDEISIHVTANIEAPPVIPAEPFRISGVGIVDGKIVITAGGLVPGQQYHLQTSEDLENFDPVPGSTFATGDPIPELEIESGVPRKFVRIATGPVPPE